MDDELLDLVDENDNIIGEVLKSHANSDPKLIHREAAIAVFNTKGEVLLQQRALTKRNNPGAWKTTAAGHVGKGEDPKVAVKRELNEELGITVEPHFMYKELEDFKNLERRFSYVYWGLLKEDQPLVLDKEEVMDAKWVTFEDLEEFSKHNDYSLESGSHEMITQAYALILDKRLV